MKTKKLFKSPFRSGSSTLTPAITALIGGLAVGAILGVLFAPGCKAIRQKLSDAFTGLWHGRTEESSADSEFHPKMTVHQSGKRPKSAIKELIHHSHRMSAHSDEPLG